MHLSKIRLSALAICLGVSFSEISLEKTFKQSLAPDSSIQEQKEKIKLSHLEIVTPENIKPKNFDSMARTTSLFPRAVDIKRIMLLAHASAQSHGREKPTIVSVGCGSFFMENLMAQEGATVIGIDPNEELVKKVARIYNLKETKPGSKIYVSTNKKADLIAMVGSARQAPFLLSKIKGISFSPYPNEIQELERKLQQEIRQISPLFDLFHELSEQQDKTALSKVVDEIKEKYPALLDLYEKIRETKIRYRSEGKSNNPIDLVFNSWMPDGIDLRRDLEELGAEFLVLAGDETWEFTGVDVEAYWFSTNEIEDIPIFYFIKEGIFKNTYDESLQYPLASSWNAPSAASHKSQYYVYTSKDASKKSFDLAKATTKVQLEKETDMPLPWEFKDFWNEADYRMTPLEASSWRLVSDQFAMSETFRETDLARTIESKHQAFLNLLTRVRPSLQTIETSL